jgi:hypothetical protein
MINIIIIILTIVVSLIGFFISFQTYSNTVKLKDVDFQKDDLKSYKRRAGLKKHNHRFKIFIKKETKSVEKKQDNNIKL